MANETTMLLVRSEGLAQIDENNESNNIEEQEDATSPLSPRQSRVTPEGHPVSSLNFERIVNQYSIQVERDRWLLPLLPEDGSSSSYARRRQSSSSSRELNLEGCENISDSESDKDSVRKNNNIRKPKKRHVFGYSGKTATRWVLTAVAGLLTGLTSILIVRVSGTVIGWRTRHLQFLIGSPDYSDGAVRLIFLSLNLVEALVACGLCVKGVPTAAGSGIDAVKAHLNGIRGHEKFTRINLFGVKIVGTILSVSSGLAVGQEGPLVHIGAIMGSACSKVSGIVSRSLQNWQNWTSCGDRFSSSFGSSTYTGGRRTLAQRILTWTVTELNQFATDGERRDLVSIGASCGFAASFGAPIGGLLFILDDISSYFSKNLILRILVANTIGTFCLAAQHHDLSNYSVINLGSYSEALDSGIFINRVEEVPLYVFVGIIGGILGGGFCAAFMFLRRNVTGRFPARGQGRAKWQFLEVAVVSILTSLLIFYLPSQDWACKAIADDGADYFDSYSGGNEALIGAVEHESSQFFCGPGQVNELASMLFGSRIDAIKRILTDPSQFKWETLLAVGMLFYVLMTLTAGVAIPCGIFTPTVLVGASLGGAAGTFFQNLVDESITPSTFALLGVAALLAGIQRSTVSIAVILVEGTGQIKILTPAIITIVIARYVAGLIHKKGFFEAVMEWKNIPYLDSAENKTRYDAIEVGDILTDCPVESVRPLESAERLAQVLQESKHHGFPVIDQETKRFLGLIRRDQIAALLECGQVSRSLWFNGTSSSWARPQTVVDKGPLMRWAYHINDDRYDYIRPHTINSVPKTNVVERAPRFSMISSRQIQISDYSALPTEFAAVERNEDGLVYVSWLNPDYEKHWVNIGAVMNRGAFVVTEFCPVSKAYQMFTSLGLRHIVVLGGNGIGGEVIGILSRANLLPEYIRSRTGL